MTLTPVRETAAVAVRRVDLTRRMHATTRLLARFGLVGAVSFVIDAGGYNLLRSLEVGPVSSKVASVVLATTFAFLASKGWTFEGRDHGRASTAYALFVAINGISLVIGVGCLAFSTYVLGLTSPLAENVSGNLIGVGLGTLFRFWAYQRWVFRHAPARASASVPTPPPSDIP